MLKLTSWEAVCMVLEHPNYLVLKATQVAARSHTALCLSRYKFLKLRHCLTGGEPLNAEVWEQWKGQTGLDLHEGYGQTEVVCAEGTAEPLECPYHA